MKALESFVGNPLPREILSRAVTSGKLGHAYLFSGEEGIGKRTLARAVGIGLLCPGGFPPCETCKFCKYAADGMHPDLMEIFPDGNTFKIAQIKELQEKLSLKPVYGGRKVFILDAVDLMNPEAANAFLKSLEEPPPETHFFLITSRPHLLPDTILSRCQQIRFYPPSTREIASLLLKKRETSPAEAEKIARRACGRVGVALTLDSAAIDAEDQKMKRLVDPETLASHSRIFQLSEEMGRDAENLRAALDWLSLWIRDML
ncbi:MAG TPA: DNA polymerase III subunit delta', partial [Nitrospiria bacterium]|nr:DNA polymerase III subunit delta' [Nitrospiria bacterium]